jgi:hypothetical protein
MHTSDTADVIVPTSTRLPKRTVGAPIQAFEKSFPAVKSY